MRPRHGTDHRARQRTLGSPARYTRADGFDGDLTSVLDSESSRAGRDCPLHRAASLHSAERAPRKEGVIALPPAPEPAGPPTRTDEIAALHVDFRGAFA